MALPMGTEGVNKLLRQLTAWPPSHEAYYPYILTHPPPLSLSPSSPLHQPIPGSPLKPLSIWFTPHPCSPRLTSSSTHPLGHLPDLSETPSWLMPGQPANCPMCSLITPSTSQNTVGPPAWAACRAMRDCLFRRRLNSAGSRDTPLAQRTYS